MEQLIKQLEKFAEERDWNQFHTPKNLAMALSVEVAEIVEIFQWLTTEESVSFSDDKLAHLEEEIGDVMNYLVSLAGKYGIDPIEAAKKKIRINEKKYPAETVRGKGGEVHRILKNSLDNGVFKFSD